MKSPFSKEKWIDHCSLARRPVVPVNLVMMMLVVHGVYVSVRKYVKGWKEARAIGRMRSFEMLRILVCENTEECGKIQKEQTSSKILRSDVRWSRKIGRTSNGKEAV